MTLYKIMDSETVYLIIVYCVLVSFTFNYNIYFGMALLRKNKNNYFLFFDTLCQIKIIFNSYKNKIYYIIYIYL